MTIEQFDVLEESTADVANLFRIDTGLLSCETTSSLETAFCGCNCRNPTTAKRRFEFILTTEYCSALTNSSVVTCITWLTSLTPHENFLVIVVVSLLLISARHATTGRIGCYSADLICDFGGSLVQMSSPRTNANHGQRTGCLLQATLHA